MSARRRFRVLETTLQTHRALPQYAGMLAPVLADLEDALWEVSVAASVRQGIGHALRATFEEEEAATLLRLIPAAQAFRLVERVCRTVCASRETHVENAEKRRVMLKTLCTALDVHCEAERSRGEGEVATL